MENKKFLTESARITDAYSQMYAQKAQINESSECGSFNAALRKGDLSIEGKGSAKTGSKLGRRPMLPFEKRDAKSTAGHKIPMRKNRQFEKVCGNCKSTGGKSVNSGLTQDGLGKRDMLPFEKRDAKPTSIGKISGVKDVGCVKGIKESEEDFEMDIIDTNADNGVEDVDAEVEGSDDEACECCEECKELLQTVSDVLEQIYDSLSDDDKALIDEIKEQISEKLSDGDDEDAESELDSADESILIEAAPTRKGGNKKPTTNTNPSNRRPTKVNVSRESAIKEIDAKIESLTNVNKNRNSDVEAWKAETEALIDSKVSSGDITAEEAAIFKDGVEKRFNDTHSSSDVKGNIQKEIDELLAKDKNENPEAYEAARKEILKEVEKYRGKTLTENEAQSLSIQIKNKLEKAGGLLGEFGKSISESKIFNILKYVAIVGGTSATTIGATALANRNGNSANIGNGDGSSPRIGNPGSTPDNSVQPEGKTPEQGFKDAKTTPDAGEKDEQKALSGNSGASSSSGMSDEEFNSRMDKYLAAKGYTKVADDKKSDSDENKGGLLTRTLAKGTNMFANTAKGLGDGIGGFASGALGGVVKPVADLANALI